MHPFFSDRNIRLYCEDVCVALQSVPVDSIDLIFADPPYNLSNGGFSCHAGKRVNVNKGEWDRSRGVEKDFQFHFNWIEACKRVLKPTGSLWISGTYHSIYACGFSLQKKGWHILNEISWYKPNAAPNLACRMFAASHETLIWAKKVKSAKHTFHYKEIKNLDWGKDFLKKPEKQMRSVWAINTPAPSEKKHGKHPTQKPEELLKRIVLATSNERDIVLDPFCGSATTGVVSLKNNRAFVGIDNEKEYLEKYAIPRLNDVTGKKNLDTESEGKISYNENILDKILTVV